MSLLLFVVRLYDMLTEIFLEWLQNRQILGQEKCDTCLYPSSSFVTDASDFPLPVSAAAGCTAGTPIVNLPSADRFIHLENPRPCDKTSYLAGQAC